MKPRHFHPCPLQRIQRYTASLLFLWDVYGFNHLNRVLRWSSPTSSLQPVTNSPSQTLTVYSLKPIALNNTICTKLKMSGRKLRRHPAVIQEEVELQHHDIQRILAENTHVIEENVILQRELTGVKDEIHRLGQIIIPKLHADREARSRDLIERGMKLEAELRDADPLRADLTHLRNEAKKINTLNHELSNQLQTLTSDTTRLRAENQQVVAIKTDIDRMEKDLAEMRRDYEMLKKTNEEHMIQKEAMEKNLISMAREIEKLQMRAGPDMRYPAGGYAGSWGSYDHPPRH